MLHFSFIILEWFIIDSGVIWLALWVGDIKQILCFDWHYYSFHITKNSWKNIKIKGYLLGICVVSSFSINYLSFLFFTSFLFCFSCIYVQQLGQYPAILSDLHVHLVMRTVVFCTSYFSVLYPVFYCNHTGLLLDPYSLHLTALRSPL